MTSDETRRAIPGEAGHEVEQVHTRIMSALIGILIASLAIVMCTWLWPSASALPAQAGPVPASDNDFVLSMTGSTFGPGVVDVVAGPVPRPFFIGRAPLNVYVSIQNLGDRPIQFNDTGTNQSFVVEAGTCRSQLCGTFGAANWMVTYAGAVGDHLRFVWCAK